MVKRALLALLGLMTFSAHAVVILQYHHVSETTPAATSVTPAQFREQMQFLADDGFKVIPLSQVVEAIKNKQDLPAKTVAITFDDGYRSIATTAHPILKEFGFPYTLFVAIEPIKQKFTEMMAWEDLIKLSKEGADIANHSWAHEHLIRKLDNESQSQWLARIKANILDTENAIREATGQNFKMLAYPYGEYNQAIQDMLTDNGFVAFGQQSGAAGPYSPLTALPRFPVAGQYADLKSLKAKLYSLNMPVLEQTPSDPELKGGHWRPELKVKLDMSDISAKQVMCYIQGQGAKTPTWNSDNEFSIQADLALPAGRSRYNCTAPSKTRNGYYWFSQAWVRPKDDGTWVKE
ncbi:polysaccharide deacetylase [Shewanella sp. ANA-3]|uniref:polysaccharide deacetylase family protein n=1 Tax=unclassified Shewanella TaxID=196818 RepID=UPI00005DF25D|nr:MULTISPECIES: polysaccharide deacetylase family protein [unclassified Shewanella]ABK50218.1 polysaccharide deacetylase [Shewanella sp. ANA-3]MDH0450561.1 polysaccharide deacetylase family protein [Shewanella sp. GD04112]